VEGRVTVDQHASSGLLKPHAAHPSELQPGEKLVARIGGTASITPANVESATGWVSGKHVFKDVRLADALIEVNRYTDKPIVIADPRIADIHISGIFRTARPVDFANAVAAVNDVAVSQDGSGEIRLRKKPD